MMKSTGMVREADQLGRIFMLIELRRALTVSVGDPMKIYLEKEDQTFLHKYEQDCTCAVIGEILNENVESSMPKACI